MNWKTRILHLWNLLLVSLKYFFVKEWSQEKKEWELLYKNKFNLNVDFKNVKVPNRPIKNALGKEVRWTLIFIAKDLTCDLAVTFLKSILARKHDGHITRLDLKIDSDDVRNTSKTYAIWIASEDKPDKDCVYAPPYSSDFGCTLLECIVLEIKYYMKNKKNLDPWRDGGTICIGTSFRVQNQYEIPIFSMYGGYINIYSVHPQVGSINYGSIRSVVCL